MTAPISIPLIDISLYLNPKSTPESKLNVIDLVQKACSKYGFLQIKGHGIPLSVQRQIFRSCKMFFDLPPDQKEAISYETSPSQHGYERFRGQTLDKRALPDEKEGFMMGREEPFEKGFQQGPNQWPILPSESFRTPLTAYYNHMETLARNVMEILVLGMGHPVSVLEAFTRKPVLNLKLLHYPPRQEGSSDELRFGAGEHTDFGAITLLLQQPGKHGLQVYDTAAKVWIAVPAIEDVLVVNIGDMIQKWTEGEYRSTLHRVINAGDCDRYSVPCFYEGDFSAINPFKPEETGGETVEEYVRRRFDSSYTLNMSA